MAAKVQCFACGFDVTDKPRVPVGAWSLPEAVMLCTDCEPIARTLRADLAVVDWDDLVVLKRELNAAPVATARAEKRRGDAWKRFQSYRRAGLR